MLIQLKKSVESWQEIVLRLSNYFQAKGLMQKSNIDLLKTATCEELLVLGLLRSLYVKMTNNQYAAKPKTTLSINISIAEAVALVAISNRPLSESDHDTYTASSIRQLTAEIDRAVTNLPVAPAASMIPYPTQLTA